MLWRQEGTRLVQEGTGKAGVGCRRKLVKSLASLFSARPDESSSFASDGEQGTRIVDPSRLTSVKIAEKRHRLTALSYDGPPSTSCEATETSFLISAFAPLAYEAE
jgi:hypothetical protein